MVLKISHKTEYRYDDIVELNTHYIFLKPLQRPYLELKQYQIEVFPAPLGLVERLSIEGNPYIQAWFTSKTDSLQLSTSIELTTKPFNPFDFIIDFEFLNNINCNEESFFNYNSKDAVLLAPYLVKSNGSNFLPFANKIFHSNQCDPLQYLIAITSAIPKDWKHIIREEENLWDAEYTFSRNEGSCRDLSWMLIQMLRRQGLASRFVSGYAYNPELTEGHELHAWVEVYLPGAGWIGIDPSKGLFSDENYIPLACSNYPENTLPIHGNFAGAANSKLKTKVEIREGR